ncbi:MAG: Crp/Fnr family transcriptional regulator [Desulfovibrio sp.]|jgi:CRP-like cAMP-binding protein|nr:Crp/Fnr family transcriptional regulator [Desulfovibrio sp.]
MKIYPPALYDCPLFTGIAGEDLHSLLVCLSANRNNFARESFVFRAEEKVESVGIVLSGGAHIVQEDFWGNRTILARIEAGGLFGEAFACAGLEKLPLSVVAAEASEIMLVNCGRILSPCTAACSFHALLIKNMMRVLAHKNILLTRKIEHITRRGTRAKLLSYLSEQATLAGCADFTIPFSRQELADFLALDRSAMSSELGRMRDEGLLRFSRNRFELLPGSCVR